MGVSCVNLAICIQLEIQMIYFVTAFVRGVAAAKEVVVRGRRARPEGPAAALLDAVQRSGVQGVRGVEAKRERERLISISSWFIH